MESKSVEEKILLPHHEQQDLCTTRLPYRQGRKLTAVKVYTINSESRHLLIFGVPSLNLRQEAKALFSKFGKVLQFNLSMEHACESFTETYHLLYDKIQQARVAKRMMDTKTFYGGSLHICYAPEYETVDDTRQKIMLRKRDVLARLKNLEKDTNNKSEIQKQNVSETPAKQDNIKLNMGELNVISVRKHMRDVVFKSNLKRKAETKVVIEKQFKPCFADLPKNSEKVIDVIDCTSIESDTITNIDVDKTLNYNTFGNELIKKIPVKPPNCIIFHVGNKKS